jgi:peroxiredoxin
VQKTFAFLILLASAVVHGQSYSTTPNTVYKDSLGNIIAAKKYHRTYKNTDYQGITILDTVNRTVTEIRPRRYTAEELVKVKAFRLKKIFEGDPAPVFEIRDINNKSIDLQQLLGKVIVLNFWFIGCGPCRKEMPKLKILTETYGNSNEIVFLSIAQDSDEALRKFIKTNDFGFIVAQTNREVNEKYAIHSFPTNIVINKKGTIIYEKSGYGGSIHSLKKTVEQAMKL